MKKNIYNNISSAPTGKIWRDNSEPADKSSFEYKYNDESKYIRGNKNSDDLNFDKFILEEFPEYLAGWDFTITNTGLTCFYSNKTKTFIIYDMFESDDYELENIEPDISMMLEYTFIAQPLSVRKINFNKDNKFTAEKEYTHNNQYCAFYNCDAIENSNTLDSNLFFTSNEDISTSSTIYFQYKPVFVFRVYNSSGNLSSGNLSDVILNIDSNKTAVQKSTGIYYIDLTGRENINDKVSISINCDFNGYLEVI